MFTGLVIKCNELKVKLLIYGMCWETYWHFFIVFPFFCGRVFRCAVCFSSTAIPYSFLIGFALQGKERIIAFSFVIQQVWFNYCCCRRMCFYFNFFPRADIGIHLIKQQDVSGR